MATKTKTTTIKKTANAKKSTKLDAKLGDDPHAAFDDIDYDELDEFDEPDFDSLGDDDIDLAQLPDSYDDYDNYDELVDEADDDYDDAFVEKPRKTASRTRQKRAMTNALVPTMPTALSAPGVNLGAYINAVHQIPILTAEQEEELAHRYADEGDVEAARLLVMSHLRFVIHIARSYSGYGLPQGDLIQEGNVGLIKAVKRFDPNKGVRLVSFAVHWIKAEIHEFVIRNWRIVKVATTKAHRKLFFNLRSLKKNQQPVSARRSRSDCQRLKCYRQTSARDGKPSDFV